MLMASAWKSCKMCLTLVVHTPFYNFNSQRCDGEDNRNISSQKLGGPVDSAETQGTDASEGMVLT